MNTFELTAKAQARLVSSLQKFGNALSIPHKKALYTLVESFFSMASGKLTERWAFPIPTGCGKTRAIIECCATLHHAGNTELSTVVCASRIEALCTMKREMLKCGVPESKIGLIYTAPKSVHYSEPATTDNEGRQFLLISHQRVANESHLEQFNTYHGLPRSLVIYDESLLVSDISHFNVLDLCQSLAGWIARYRLDLQTKPELSNISNWLAERLAVIQEAYEHFTAGDTNYLPDPSFALSVDEQVEYQHQFKTAGDTRLAEFVSIAHLRLRLIRHNSTAAITYQIVIPEQLKSMLVLDASYPIRQLEKVDATLHNAEDLPSCKSFGVKFNQLKRFDQVTLCRMSQRGSRSSSVDNAIQMKKLFQDVAKVIGSIPSDEGILVFVYKDRKNRNPKKALEIALRKVGLNVEEDIRLPTGEKRISIETWGNETSLNCYHYCQHVFLVGILHRDLTELEAQHLGQINDLGRKVTTEEVNDICLSERVHLAYQALSRGSCRVIGPDFQAKKMTGYIVEYDPAIETELSKVMPGAVWETWSPVYSNSVVHGQLQASLTLRIISAFSVLPTGPISNKAFKRFVLKSEKVVTETWKRALRDALGQNILWIQDDGWLKPV